MKLLIHGKNLELTDALKKYTESKIHKAINHFKDIVKEVDIHLKIGKNKGINFQSAEITIFANGTVIRAEEKSENLYSSIDLVSNKLSRQLRKFKERNTNHIQHEKHNFRDLQLDNIDNHDKEFLITKSAKGILPEPAIKNKYFEMPPISLQEAREKLDLIDHDFYFFRNKNNKELQVIYKRNHGGYGLIQSKNKN